MSASFPGSVKSFAALTDGIDSVLAAHQNDRAAEISAIETWLLTKGLGEGLMINGKISVTVSSNNLTVALKTLAGNTPSASDPVLVVLEGAVRAVTAALSVTASAGTNWCSAGSAEMGTHEIDYFAYLGYNSTDGVVLGFSRIPYAVMYLDFHTYNANERYAVISNIANASANDRYAVIGRFAATLSLGASFNWSVPSFTPRNLIQRPILETRRLGWTPAYTGFTGAVTTTTAGYHIIGRRADMENDFVGTSNATTLTFTLPFLPGGNFAGLVRGLDNGAGVAAMLNNANAVMYAYASAAAGAWTASGNKGIYQAHYDLVVGA